MDLSDNAEILLKAFQKREGASPDSWLRGNQSSEAYDELVRVWNEEAVIELVFSGLLSGHQIIDLCQYGGHGGSVSKRDNPRLWSLNKRLRERKSELPEEFRQYLDWLERAHGY